MFNFFKKTFQATFYSNGRLPDVKEKTSSDNVSDDVTSIPENTESPTDILQSKLSFLTSLVKKVTPLIRYCETSPTIKIMAGLVILGGFVTLGAAMAITTPLVGPSRRNHESEDLFELDDMTGLDQLFLDPNDVEQLTSFILARSSDEIKVLEAQLIANLDRSKLIKVDNLPERTNPTIDKWESIVNHSPAEAIVADESLTTANSAPSFVGEFATKLEEGWNDSHELGSNEPVSPGELEIMAEISKSTLRDPILISEMLGEELSESDWKGILKNPTTEHFSSSNSDNETLLHLAAKNITFGAQVFQAAHKLHDAPDWFAENVHDLSPFGVAVKAGNLKVLDFYFQHIPFYRSHLKTIVTELISHKFTDHTEPYLLFIAELELVTYFDAMIESAQSDLLNLMLVEAIEQLSEPLPDKIPEPLLQEINEQLPSKLHADLKPILNEDFFETLILANHGPLFCRLITDEKFKHATPQAILAWHNFVSVAENDVTEFLAATLRYVVINPEKYEQLKFLFIGHEKTVANDILSIHSYYLAQIKYPLTKLNDNEITKFTSQWIATEKVLAEKFFLLHKDAADFSMEKIFSYAMQSIGYNVNLAFKCFWLQPNLLLVPQYANPIIDKFRNQDKSWFPLIFNHIFSGNTKAPYYNDNGIEVYEYGADSLFKPLFDALVADKKHDFFLPQDKLHLFRWRDKLKSKISTSMVTPKVSGPTAEKEQKPENVQFESTSSEKSGFDEINFKFIGVVFGMVIIAIRYLIDYGLGMYDKTIKLSVESLFHGLPIKLDDKENDIQLTVQSEEDMVEITTSSNKKFLLSREKVSLIITDFIKKHNLFSDNEADANTYMLDKGKLWNLPVSKIVKLHQELHLKLSQAPGKKKITKNNPDESLPTTNNYHSLAGNVGVTFNKQLVDFSDKIQTLLLTIHHSFTELLTITNTNEAWLNNMGLDVFSDMASQFPEHHSTKRILMSYGDFVRDVSEFVYEVNIFLSTLPSAAEMPAQPLTEVETYKSQLKKLNEKCKQLNGRCQLDLEAIPEIDENKIQFDERLNTLQQSIDNLRHDSNALYKHYYQIKHPYEPLSEKINAQSFADLAKEFNERKDDRKTAQLVPKYALSFSNLEKLESKLQEFTERLPRNDAVEKLSSANVQHYLNELDNLTNEFSELRKSIPEGKGKRKASVAEHIFFRHSCKKPSEVTQANRLRV